MRLFPKKKNFWKKLYLKKILEFFQIFFEVIFENDHSHILREHASEYSSQHIFFLNFLKGGNNGRESRKN